MLIFSIFSQTIFVLHFCSNIWIFESIWIFENISVENISLLPSVSCYNTRSVVRTSFVGGGPFAVGNEPARAPGFSNLPPLSLLSGDQRSISDSPETLFGRIRPPPVMIPVILVSHCTGLHQWKKPRWRLLYYAAKSTGGSPEGLQQTQWLLVWKPCHASCLISASSKDLCIK